MNAQQPILSIRDLHTWFYVRGGVVKAVNGASYEVAPGETLAVVGESGSGKSVTAMSVLGLIPRPPGRIVSGEIMFDGRDLTKMNNRQLRSVRGNRIAMIFQEPMTSLNPVHTVGKQLVESMLLHKFADRREARYRALELLSKVGIAAPDQRMREYPFQLSGGMRQRVMIAMALACNPDLLIADEPTSALDVTVQLQILRLIRSLQEEMNMAVVLITHDLGVVAEVSDSVAVMYGGRVVEYGTTRDIFKNHKHPYVEGLKECIPRPDELREELAVIPGSVPNAAELPAGCPFEPRCPKAMEQCRTVMPGYTHIAGRHKVRCLLYGEGEGPERSGEPGTGGSSKTGAGRHNEAYRGGAL